MDQDTRTKALLVQLANSSEDLDLEKLLAPGAAAVHLSSEVLSEPQAQLLFFFAINLLARLHPVIQDLSVVLQGDAPLTATVPRWQKATLKEHIHSMLVAIDPPLAWRVVEKEPFPPAWSLAIGRCKPNPEAVFIGSFGWEAYFSPEAPVPTDAPANPVGAYAAACIGVGEVWKRMLVPHRGIFTAAPIIPLTEPLTFSAFTYLAGSGSDNPPLPDVVDVSRITMAGLGAGGGATAFTLASLPKLVGTANLIDPDEVEVSNLNRYIFADRKDAAHKKRKVHVIHNLFSHFSGFTTRPFAIPLAEATEHVEANDFRYVVAAMHSREARRQVQMETPMVLWDAAAAEDGEFRIWRMILGKTECMFCKHPPGEDDPEREKAAQIARLLGLTTDICLRKIRDHEPFTAEEVSNIADHVRGMSVDFDIPRPEQRFNDWETSQCGKIQLPDVDGGVPIPFAPVMAGVLLAGEIIKEHYFGKHVLDARYWNTLMGKFMIRNRPHRRQPHTGCLFCHDPAYLEQYERRWGKRE